MNCQQNVLSRKHKTNLANRQKMEMQKSVGNR